MSDSAEKEIEKPRNTAPPVPKINDLFINYYKQVYVPGTLSEEDFDKMIETFKTQLPTVFRVVKTGNNAKTVQKELDDFISFFKENGILCETLDYIPNDIGKIYKISLEKNLLRRDERFEEFHKWLKLHTSLGHCHRQEFVSMVPPFFLDVHGSMSVLDTCASPGSKTAQIIEMLSGDGYIVANDNDPRRIQSMIHQLQRVGTSRTLVVNFDAQKLPDFGEKFDRVLCDVPCTCDGTIRKNIKTVEKFSHKDAGSLHHVQKKILRRGLELTKVGGLCVYSTCSINPIEDEAVVNAVLLQLGDAVEVVDVSDKFPDLKRHKGLTYWPVFDTNLVEPTEYKDAASVPKNRQQFAHPSLFPQPQIKGLENCMHFFPQDQDSGGFFIAVLRKVKEFEPAELPPNEKKPLKELPYIPIMEQAPEVFKSIKETFELDENFPEECVFVRDDKTTKNITYVVKPLADMIKKLGSQKLRTFNLGTRVFTWKKFGKDKEYCAYPTIEGIKEALTFAHKRVYYLTPRDMFALLRATPGSVAFNKLSEETRKQFEGMGINGAILCIKDTPFAYGGMSFEKSCVIYVRKDIIDNEIEKIKQTYPELVEFEKELDEEDKIAAEKLEKKKEAEKKEKEEEPKEN